MGKAHGKQIQHFPCGSSKTYKLLFCQFPRIYNTDRHCQPFFLINDTIAHNRDTDLVVQMSHHDSLCIVKDHAGLMQEPSDNIDRMTGTVKMLLCRDNLAGRISNLDIPPLVDIDFLHIIPVQITCQERKACHLPIKKITEFRLLHSLYAHVALFQIFSDVGFNQFPVLVRVVTKHGSKVLGYILLHILQYFRKSAVYHTFV